VADSIARRIDAEHISVDRILEEEGLWKRGRRSEFLRANRFAAARAEVALRDGRPVILDGNFYWRTVIDDLLARLDFDHRVLTLNAPLSVCIERDRHRAEPHGERAARAVYAKSTAFEYGTQVDATGTVDTVVGRVLAQVREGPFAMARARRPRRTGRRPPSRGPTARDRRRRRAVTVRRVGAPIVRRRIKAST